MDFFTSDHHFGHYKIIDFMETRKHFKDAAEMNQYLIDTWNSQVKPQDTVYHLGDFSFMPKKEGQAVLSKLNGHKNLIAGNHDTPSRVHNLEGWEHVSDFRSVRTAIGLVYLFHCPIELWPKMKKGAIHLHGHTHGSLPYDPALRRMDVGVDCHDKLGLFSLEDIANKLKSTYDI